MADMIDGIVERTIAQTLRIVTTSRQSWSVAREGIEKIPMTISLAVRPAIQRSNG